MLYYSFSIAYVVFMIMEGNQMTKDRIQGYTRRICNANRSQIIVIVYEMAGEYITGALAELESGNEEAWLNEGHRAMKCVEHLMNALENGYALSSDLFKFYNFIYREISMSLALRDKDRLKRAAERLGVLKDAFVEVAGSDETESVIRNSQAVYAGLTYGKNQLNEDMIDTRGNRGFTV